VVRRCRCDPVPTQYDGRGLVGLAGMTQAEIIAGARALLEDEAISHLLHTGHTDWEATRAARVIVKRVLDVAEKIRTPR
jgi:hypothetical protein